MEKKEFPKTANPKAASVLEQKTSGFSRKVNAFSQKLFGIIKFILGVCLLPLVYSSTTSFLQEFSIVLPPVQNYFWGGVISLVMVYLFAWEPAVIYSKGHKLLEVLFSFFKPLVKVAPYLIPVYTIVLFIAYALLSLAIKEDWLLHLSLFLFGFSIALHLVFSARTIRSKKEDFLKANYIFGASFIYLVNIFIMAAGLSMVFKDFSFVSFGRSSFETAGSIFYAVFRQLFLR
jgi:hypothetical protein